MPTGFVMCAVKRYRHTKYGLGRAHNRAYAQTDTAVQRARQRRRRQNRLGFGVQLVTVRMLGRFLPDPMEVLTEIVEQLAGQAGDEDPSCLKQCAQRLPTQEAELAGRRRLLLGVGEKAAELRRQHGGAILLHQVARTGQEPKLAPREPLV